MESKQASKEPKSSQPNGISFALGTSLYAGLTSQEAASRLAEYGQNRLAEEKETRFLAILREEITEPMIVLLLAIGVLYGVVNRDLTDALTIVSITAILVLIEVWNEYRAKKSITTLRKLASPTTTVLRDGQLTEVPTTKVVPGDILILRQGERVPADALLLDSVGLEADESALTGESFPVSKDTASEVRQQITAVNKQNMVFAGTIITKGRAKALVTATGMSTELGKVAGLTKAVKEPKTPLQLSMKQLSKTLIGIALFFSILIPILAYLRGLPSTQAILYGLSLSFATVPEEMPIIITMVLGVGAYTLSRKKAIIKRLRAAETLGSTTVIATDKTGTITENKMRVETLYLDGKIVSRENFKDKQTKALETALLASDAIKGLNGNLMLSNPMSQALLDLVRQKGTDLQGLQQEWVLKDELSFDNKRKLASYIYQASGSLYAMSSGAPENILATSTQILLDDGETALNESLRKDVMDAVLQMARSGQRLLAFGYRKVEASDVPEKTSLERGLVFVGIVGFLDPPRKEVSEAIHLCRQAGIRVIMVTGDHPETARTIAQQVGISSHNVLTGDQIAKMTAEELGSALKDTSVFARTTPEDKLRLVRVLRENGEIVAVTGDGVNDAPALKEAHIGISMGIRGTDVAKENADMILSDDNFATITTAAREGRKIFANLRKGVRYYLACKIALVASFLLPIALGVPLPFAPIQIIVLELFMDLAASATFVAEPEEAGSMLSPPLDPKEGFLNKRMLTIMVAGSLSLFSAVSVCFLFTWFNTHNLVLAQTVAFAAWMLGHVFLALNLRSDKEPLFKLGIWSNKLMVLWAAVVVATLAIGTNLPYVYGSLKVTYLSLSNWALVIGVAFAATFWMELKKMLEQQPKIT